MNKTTVKSLLALTAAIALAGGAKAESYTSSQNFASSVEVTGSTVTGGATADSAVVFTATDSSTGLTVTDGNMTLGSGYWTIESGKYRFCNDLLLNDGGNFTINGGHVATKYWLVMNGTSSFTITNGTFTTAVDNGASNPNNGAMDLGREANSDITVNITGGTVTSHGSANELDKWQALMLANGANSKGRMTISNSGAYTSPNDITVGRGENSEGVITVKDSGTFNAWTMNIGFGAGSTGTVNITNDATMALEGLLNVGMSGTGNVNIMGGSVTSVNAAKVGLGSGVTGTITITGGEFKPSWVVLGAATGGTGSLIVDGGTFSPSGTVYINENNKATHNIGILEVRSGSANLHSLQAGRGSGSTGTISVSGGTLTADEDIVLGDGGKATLNISGSGTVVCQGTAQNAKWIKLGNSGSGNNAINLNEGGTLRVWHIERLTTEGTATVNFNGGTLEALGVDDGWNKYLIGNVDEAHTVNPTVTIGEKGGTIDVGENNITITSPVSGTGTIAKSGSGTLKFTGSYFGGISVNDGAGSVTTPGSDTVSAGAAVFLASGANGTVPAATLDGKTLWVEANGHVTLSGVTLDFSSATEQKLFDVTSFKLLGTTVSAETDVSGYFSIADAAVPYKVIYKSDGLYAVYNPTENVWIGGAEGVWSEASNWSEGVIPSETSLVAFTNDTVITCSGTGAAKHWLKLRLADATLELKNTDDSTYPGWELGADSIEGNGTIVLTHCGFYATADVTIPDTISLVIKNSGTIENGNDCWLTAADGSTLTVAGSVAVTNFMLTNGSVVFGGDVSVADGARVYIASGTTTFNGALACNGTAILEKAAGASVAKGENSTFTQPTVGSSHVDAAIASLYSVDTSVNYWVGGASGYWNEKNNWNYGIPVSTQKVVIDSATSVNLNGGWNATDSDACKAGVLELNAEVTFTGDGYKRVFLYGLDGVDMVGGTGSLKLSGNTGLENYSAAVQEIKCPIDFHSTDNHTWLGGNSYGWTVSAATTVSAWMQCDKPVSFTAPITGEGAVHIMDGGAGTVFSGDNRGFHGTVDKDGNNRSYIDGVNAAGTNVIWDIVGDMEVRNVSSGETVKFGALTLTKSNYCVMYFHEGTPITLEVGSRNTDCAFNDGYFFWSSGTDLKNVDITIKKVGTGTLTSYAYNFKNVIVDNGAFVLNNPTGAMDGNSFTQIDSVAVKSGAALSGNVGSEEGKLTIASLDFEAGAILKATLDATPLAVAAAVDVSGLKVQLTNPEVINDVMNGTDEDAKATLIATPFTVLSATSITGNAQLGSELVAKGASYAWGLKSAGTSLNLRHAKLGFLILFR